MRYEDGRKAKTREKIVKEAANAIRFKGTEQISVAEVMSQAGLTHGGFYAHFKNKNALIAAAIQQMFEEGLTVFTARTGNLEARAALSSYIAYYLSSQHLYNRAFGCPLASMGHELPNLDEESRRVFCQGMKNLFGCVADKLAEVGFEQPMQLSQSIFAEMVGAMTIARCESNTDMAEQVLLVSHTAIKARLGF